MLGFFILPQFFGVEAVHLNNFKQRGAAGDVAGCYHNAAVRINVVARISERLPHEVRALRTLGYFSLILFRENAYGERVGDSLKRIVRIFRNFGANIEGSFEA